MEAAGLDVEAAVPDAVEVALGVEAAPGVEAVDLGVVGDLEVEAVPGVVEAALDVEVDPVAVAVEVVYLAAVAAAQS